MISARQIKAARTLVGWTQSQLADKAVVSVNALARLEAGRADTRTSTVTRIQTALEKAGIDFLMPGGGKGEGVRLATPTPHTQPRARRMR